MSSTSSATAFPLVKDPKVSLPPSANSALIQDLTFEESCISSRVCKAWNQALTIALDQQLTSFRQSNMHLGIIESLIKSTKTPDGTYPEPIKDLQDLKRRIASIRRFSLEVRTAFNKPSELFVLARLTNFRTIAGRSWMGFYKLHVRFDTPLGDHLMDEEMSTPLEGLARQKKVCLVREGISSNSVSNTGYLVGAEENLSKYLSTALTILYYLPIWLDLREKPGEAERFAIAETALIEKIKLPICFISGDEMKIFLPLLRNSSQPFAVALQDSLAEATINALLKHQEQGTLTPAKEKEIATQFLLKRSAKVLQLCKVLVEDTTHALNKKRLLDNKDVTKILKFAGMQPGNDRKALFEEVVMPIVLTTLRSKMWAVNAREKMVSIPTSVPHILDGGGNHINEVFSHISTLPSDEKQSVVSASGAKVAKKKGKK